MKKLILASASPARKQILEGAKVPFTVEVSNYEEDMTLKLPPPELAKFLSKGKARDVAAKHKSGVVLGADSFGVINGQLLGKPHTIQRAKAMLKTLNGQCHIFLTGFTIIDSSTNKEYSEVVETKVYFRKLTPAEINNYVVKENVLNNAGAYIIHGLGGSLVEKIDGDHNNVMGLPLTKVALALKDFGINLI